MIKQLPNKELLRELFFYENGVLSHKKVGLEAKQINQLVGLRKMVIGQPMFLV